MNGRDAVASTADAAFAVDMNGRIIAWNDGAMTTFGWTAKEAKGKQCWELLQGRDVYGNRYCSEKCPIREMALCGQPVHRHQVHFRNALGDKVRVEAATLVVSGATGRDREIVHLLRSPSPVEHRSVARQLPPTSGRSHSPLSERQIEVLILLAGSRSTREIAENLCLSPATVRHHIEEILKRLKVHSRLEAVLLAQRIGLV